MACNYIVSAQKPTVVTHSVVGNFRSVDVVELMVARINRLELLSATTHGITALYEFPIYGRVCFLGKFRRQSEQLDSLIIVTTKLDLAVLRFNSEGELVPRCHGNVADRIGRPSDTGILVTVHPERGTIAVRQNDGCLKLIQWGDQNEMRISTVRTDDLSIVDISFVLDPLKPGSTLMAYIYQDCGQHLKQVEITYGGEVNCNEVWRIEHIDAEIVMACPAPYGGFTTIGQGVISYHKDQKTYFTCDSPITHTTFTSFALIDAESGRFLLGDMEGHLFMLILIFQRYEDGRSEVRSVKIELLGQTTHPESICYLDNGVVFVGSRFGDSALLRLQCTPDSSDQTNFLSHIDTYPNLGPIQDMVVMKSDSQTQVVTCSGAYGNGSLRVVRSGIGIDTLITVDIERVIAIFPLTLKEDTKFHTHLVLSHFNETRFLSIDGAEFEDVSSSMEMFITDQRTFWIGQMPGRVMVQVTESEIRSVLDGKHISEPFPLPISCVSVNQKFGQLLVSVGDTVFAYKFRDDGTASKIFEDKMDDEIACLDISSFEDETESKVFAVGFWKTKEVRLYTTDAKPDIITRVELDPKDILRSVLMIKMEATPYVLVSLADGTIHYYIADFENSSLTDHKRAALGRLPINLVKFNSRGHTTVFACGDRPTVLFSSNRKLVFSNVNLKLVETMCSFNTEEYPNTLIFVSHSDLTIGTVDDIKKLHIRRVNVGESVRRMAHQPETNTAALLTFRMEKRGPDGRLHCPPCYSKSCQSVTSSTVANVTIDQDVTLGDVVTIHSICFVETEHFEPFHVHDLGPCEHALSVASVRLGEEDRLFYVVGTAVSHPDEHECKVGRVMVFECIPETQTGDMKKRVNLVTEKEVKGAVFALVGLEKYKKVVAAVNSTLRLFEFTDKNELRLECSYFNFINCLYLKARGEYIIGGDIMRSVAVILYRPIESSLSEISRDYNTSWVTACEIVDCNTYIAAENGNNIYTLQRDISAKSEEDKHRLINTGQFYLGEMINCISTGELLNAPLDSSVIFKNTLLFGTVDGGIGVIVQLEPHIFEYLRELESRLSKFIPNCMRVTHMKYREFHNESRREQYSGFIDGDLIEGLLDLSKEEVEGLIKGLQMRGKGPKDPSVELNVDELMKMVEDLSRIH